MDPVTIVALVLAIPLCILLIKWKHQYWRRQEVPQLSPAFLFGDFGPVYTGKVSYKDFFLDIYKSAKSAGHKYVGLYATTNPQFVPIDLDLIKLILSKDFSYFLSRGAVFHKSIELTTSVLNMEGEEWKDRRVKLSPLFSSGKIKVMFETVAATANHLIDAVDNLATSNQPIPCKDICTRFATDIISTVAFGLESNSLKNPENIFRRIGNQIFQPSLLTITLESLLPSHVLAAAKYQRFPFQVRNYFSGIVKDTIKYRESTKFERRDFLQLMIDEKNFTALSDKHSNKKTSFIDDDEIVNESFTFFIAGFETSSSTMTFALLELAQNQDIQQTLRKDILDTLEKHNGQITYESISEMKYLDRVVKETLRKYPIVITLRRKCTKNYKIPGTNVIIKKGTKVHIPVIGVHMDPEYYENPEEFNPNNFLPEKVQKRPDFAYLAFGEGPRLCIGMRFGQIQTKVGLVALLKNFQFSLHDSIKPPFETEYGVRTYMLKQSPLLVASKITDRD